MLFNVQDWETLFLATIVTFATLLVQLLSYDCITEDWLEWYEGSVSPLFEKTRCMNHTVGSALLALSAAGFFFCLSDQSGDSETPGVFWNYAIVAYLLLTLFEGLWLCPLWHYRSSRASIACLYAALGSGVVYLLVGLVGISNPIPAVLLVAPRVAWLAYVLVRDVFTLRKKIEDHKIEDKTLQPTASRSSLPMPSQYPSSSQPPPSSQSLPAGAPAGTTSWQRDNEGNTLYFRGNTLIGHVPQFVV